MKKLLVVLFVSSISINSIFVNNIEASDIKEFEIAGMSIGDSLLKFYSKNEIINAKKKNTYQKYPGGKFAIISFPDTKNKDQYEAIVFVIKPNDNNYKIYSIAGRIGFDNRLQACKKKMNSIFDEISKIITDPNYRKEDGPHFEDTTGKSMTYGYVFYLERGAVDLYCVDWSKEFEIKKGYMDNLNVTVHSHEMRTYLTNMYEKSNK